MQTKTDALKALRVAGFKFPHELGLFHHPLLDDSGRAINPCDLGFDVAYTGGGCQALQLVVGDFLIMLTGEDGCHIPELEDWAENLIGVYHNSDEREEVALLTGLEWQELMQ